MPILKCKMCGGDIIFTGESSVGRCDCCGSTTTLPTIGEERLTNLFNRANHLRMRGEFDRAATTYERILAENEFSAEAHWGIVLCQYGIEYVEDPDTHRRVPTCRLAQQGSILQHEDYLDAVRYADPEAKELYQKEAVYIDTVQREIQMLARSEQPYDIFISYKELTDSGERTKASVLAQDLYTRLDKEGYRVFFSRITLENKLGQQYEPYIFAALNSAKVMLVVGTEPEHFTAPWVHNEWGRFLSLQRERPDRRLIPCYRDMEPYDLPDELSLLQCQDMSKIGFEQDLLRGLEKLLQRNSAAGAVDTPVSRPEDANALIRRGQLFLGDRNWDAASSCFNRALDIVPERAEAYIGKLCAELKSPSFEDIVPSCRTRLDCKTQTPETVTVLLPLNLHDSYIKAMRFSDGEMRDKLEQCHKEVAELINAYEAEKQQQLSGVIGDMQAQITRHTQDIDTAAQRVKKCEIRVRQLREERRKFNPNHSSMADEAEPSHFSVGIIAFLFPVLGGLAMNSIGLGKVGFLIGLVIGIIFYRIRTTSLDQRFEELGHQVIRENEEITEVSNKISTLTHQRDMLENQLQMRQEQYTKFLSRITMRQEGGHDGYHSSN